jgi:hypothetical protein
MLTDTVKDIVYRIGQFYLQKHNNNHVAAIDELTQLRISDVKTNESDADFLVAADWLEEHGWAERVVKYLRDKGKGLEGGIEIHTARPGILIGPRGRNIDALSKYLGCEIRIIEDVDSIGEALTTAVLANVEPDYGDFGY